MSSAKIAITIDQNLLARLDRLVVERQFPSRSRALQDALRDKLVKFSVTRIKPRPSGMIARRNSAN